MYYVNIPLQHLCKPEELNVPQEQQQATWDRRAEGLMDEIGQGRIPSWAVGTETLKSVVLEEDSPD